MIISVLRGGVGNQLFQYAFARALSIKRKQILVLDISQLKKTSVSFGSLKKSRDYQLKSLNVKAIIVGGFVHYIGKYFNDINKLVNDEPFYDISLVNKTYKHRNIILNGYWMSEDYFSEYESYIRNDLKMTLETSRVLDFKKQLLDLPFKSVSLHIRRGDYVTNSSVASRNGVLPMDYYEKAISMVNDNVKNPYFFIFSDDIEWVKSNLKIDGLCEFIVPDINNPIDELFMMSSCNHNIIANSTYSWWGAWLNAHKDKIVIAPKNWYINNKPNSKDLIPKKWIKI